MVIGPTPPGTGVIAPATALTPAKSTSPTSRVLPSSAAGTRLMPTSITQAPGFTQSRLDHFRPPDRGDDDVGAADDIGEVARPRMGDGDGAALLDQQLRHRLADQDRAADDDGVEPRKLAEPVLEQHQAAERGAGDEAGQAQRQPAGADRGQAIDVLARVDPVDHRLLVEMVGKRQLDEDAVDRGIGVEPVDQRVQRLLGGIGGKQVLEALHAAGHGLLALVADIDLAGRILADQHHREPRLAPGGRLEACRHLRHPGAQAFGEGLAVDDRRGAHTA